jgi:hypothetical protein
MNWKVPIVDPSVGHERWWLSEFGMEAAGLVQRQVGDERLWSMPGIPLEALAARRQSTQEGGATHEATPARTPAIAVDP